MTTKILMKNQIKSEVLKVLSGYCFENRKPESPKIFILTPWISNVKLQLNEMVYKLDPVWFGYDYGYDTILLSTALLFLRLDFGADITIITRPFTDSVYKTQVDQERVRNLLDFFDEIGCNVFTHKNFHTKLILSNDLALVGSFNLTKPALWGREEIGVAIDDVENLNIRESYAKRLEQSSITYGYSAKIRTQLIPDCMTRGVLFEKVIKDYFTKRSCETKWDFTPSDSHDFLYFHFRTITAQSLLNMVEENIDNFYKKVLLAYLRSEELSIEQKLAFLGHTINYQGKYEIDEILNFLSTMLVRKSLSYLYETAS